MPLRLPLETLRLESAPYFLLPKGTQESINVFAKNYGSQNSLAHKGIASSQTLLVFYPYEQNQIELARQVAHKTGVNKICSIHSYFTQGNSLYEIIETLYQAILAAPTATLFYLEVQLGYFAGLTELGRLVQSAIDMVSQHPSFRNKRHIFLVVCHPLGRMAFGKHCFDHVIESEELDLKDIETIFRNVFNAQSLSANPYSSIYPKAPRVDSGTLARLISTAIANAMLDGKESISVDALEDVFNKILQ